MKRIIIGILGSIVLYAVVSIGNAFSSDLPDFELEQDTNRIVDKVQEDEKLEDKSEIIYEKPEEESTESVDILSGVSNETEKSNMKESSESTKKQETIKQPIQKTEPTKEENNPISEPQPVVEEPKQQEVPTNKTVNPWDRLGISEYDYYNKPDHSWAEVDFKLSDYGSEEATLNACKEYGKQHGGGFFCDRVNSYSGNYLGEDIDFY